MARESFSTESDDAPSRVRKNRARAIGVGRSRPEPPEVHEGELHVHPSTAEAQARDAARSVCPFCGGISASREKICPACEMEDTPATRQATRQRIGPWFVLQKRNPAAPGMNLSTLQSLIEKGRVTARSIVRGPTTHQLWRQASRIKGLSREFGICWGCAQEIGHAARMCPNCKRMQEPPMAADALVEGHDASPGGMAGINILGRGPGWAEPAGAVVGTMPGVSAASRMQALDLGKPAARADNIEFAGFGLGAQRPAAGGSRAFRWMVVLVAVLVIATAAIYAFDRPLWNRSSQWVEQTVRSSTPSNSEPPAATWKTPPFPTDAPPTRSAPVKSTTTHPAQTNKTIRPPATAPASVVEVPAPAPAPEPVNLTLEQAREKAQALRMNAFEAARRKDYKAALEMWEQMGRMSDDVRHPDWEKYRDEMRERLRR